ncbi:MAG TPA: hypothetical protein VGJ90_04070 [Methylophilaceae bacterium]|jgi:hypothetical protein
MALDSQPNGNVEFEAEDHLKQILAGKKAKVAIYFQASYPEGWKMIVESFIDSIKRYSIEIKSISDDHYQLDVEFAVVGRSHEARVWRAVDTLRKMSWKTCSACGEEKGTNFRGGDTHSVTKCRTCLRSGKGGTGTWLDKY